MVVSTHAAVRYFSPLIAYLARLASAANHSLSTNHAHTQLHTILLLHVYSVRIYHCNGTVVATHTYWPKLCVITNIYHSNDP